MDRASTELEWAVYACFNNYEPYESVGQLAADVDRAITVIVEAVDANTRRIEALESKVGHAEGVRRAHEAYVQEQSERW